MATDDIIPGDYKPRLIAGYTCFDIGKSIVRPFHKYIDEIMGIREKITIDDQEQAELIKSTDTDQILIHVDHLPRNKERAKDLWVIWRKEHWASAYDTHQQKKFESEVERQKYFKRKENIEKLTCGIVKLVGVSDEQALSLATVIYDSKNELMAKQYYREVEFI